LVIALPLDGETRPFIGTAIEEPGADANARTLANSLRRITLDDGLGTQNPGTVRHPNGAPFSSSNRFRGGDIVQNAVGVLGYGSNTYRIQPTGPADHAATNSRPGSPAPVGGSLRVAAMNTLNFFLTLDRPAGDLLDNTCGPLKNVECRGADADQPTEFTRQRTKLIATLAGLDADVIGLSEIENTLGVEPLADIVAGLPGYAYIDTGIIGTDAIRVGLLYRPAKVVPVGAFKILDSTVDPRFLDSKNRPTLAQTFQDVANGGRFTVAVNHLKSKGSACDDVGDPDQGDGQGNCNATRRRAAQALVDWLATDPTGSGDPDFLILGDLNSYAQEDPIFVIKEGADDALGTGDDYTNLFAYFEGDYAYSYTFDGQAGYLDHALATRSLLAQVTGATHWHINSDEPDILDYDTSFKPDAQDALYEPNAYRSSDHDALVVGLHVSGAIPPALLQGAVSRKTHGGAGTFDLALNALATNPTTDPRSGGASGNHSIVFIFDKAVTGGTASVIAGVGTAGTPTFSGNEMVVPLSGVTNQQYVTVSVSDVAGADGSVGGTGSVRIGFLVGDANGNRVVTVSDLAQVNAQIAQVVTASNYLKDVNASGALTTPEPSV
jgi:predicted extracellular nuclease